jgi:hypothetical protein
MNTLNANDEKGIFALLKGESGAGKSVAGLSFPGLYVFDYDVKMPSIAQKHFPKKSTDWDTFSDTDQISDKIKEWLKCPICGHQRLCEQAGGQCGTSCPYETLLHDSLTHMENLVTKTIAIAKDEEVPKMIKQMVKTKAGTSKADLMDFDYYKAEMRFTDWLMSVNKVLWARNGNPKHVLFTAHVVTTEQKNIMTGLVTRTRSIVSQGNKVAAFIPTNFDNVFMFGYQEIGGLDGQETEIKRFALTRPMGEDDGKSSYDLPRMIDFTNGNFYEKLMASIRGQKFNASI